MTNTNLTEEEKNILRQLNFYYETVTKDSKTLSDNELFNRLLNLDNSLKRKAFIKAFCEGLGGFVLFISGYNMLTHLEHAFLTGIIFFSLGSIIIATSYPDRAYCGMAVTNIRTTSLSISRIFLAVSIPLIPGISISIRIRSYCPLKHSRKLSPLSNVDT